MCSTHLNQIMVYVHKIGGPVCKSAENPEDASPLNHGFLHNIHSLANSGMKKSSWVQGSSPISRLAELQ
jgi:hypothetical protein